MTEKMDRNTALWFALGIGSLVLVAALILALLIGSKLVDYTMNGPIPPVGKPSPSPSAKR